MIHSGAMRFQLPHSAQLSVHDWARYMMLFISSLPHCIQMAANCRPSLDILAAEFNNKSKEDCCSLRVIQSGSKGRMSQPQATSGASEVSSSCSPLRSAVPHMVAPQKSTNHNTIHNIPQHSTTFHNQLRDLRAALQPCSPSVLLRRLRRQDSQLQRPELQQRHQFIPWTTQSRSTIDLQENLSWKLLEDAEAWYNLYRIVTQYDSMMKNTIQQLIQQVSTNYINFLIRID